MEKLELKHLTPYLPYRLNMLYDFEMGDVWTLDTTNINAITEYDKPILKPLSDLTKEIEVNGKKIIPLIELYRCSNEYNYSENLDYEFIDSWGARGNILKVFHNREKDEYTEFVFGKLSFRKNRKYLKGSYVFGMYLPHDISVNSKLYNNHKLYNLLYIWHFDVFGLIEKGLAIDINKLAQFKNIS